MGIGVVLLIVLLVMTAVMTAAWIVQRATDNGGWADVFWTLGAGAACAGAALAPIDGASGPSWRQVMVAALVAVWSLRLGGYLWVRVARRPEDARYALFRRAWANAFQGRMLALLLVQAPVTVLLSASVAVAARATGALRITDAAGAAILAVAILGESVADRQMKRFRADPANRSAVCETGLWSWSRHPNYFFEGLGWVAYPIIGLRLNDPWSLATLIAPAVMFALLRFGSGVPPLEAVMLESRGEAYRRYQARVSPMFPRPPRKSCPP